MINFLGNNHANCSDFLLVIFYERATQFCYLGGRELSWHYIINRRFNQHVTQDICQIICHYFLLFRATVILQRQYQRIIGDLEVQFNEYCNSQLHKYENIKQEKRIL